VSFLFLLFNDVTNDIKSLVNDEMIALALTMEEAQPHQGAPLWLQQQREQQLRAQRVNEERAARQQELRGLTSFHTH